MAVGGRGWSLWLRQLSGGVRAVGGGLVCGTGCVVVVLECLSLSVTLLRREEVRAEMSGLVMVEVTSSCSGRGVKPQRQSVSGTKSSVSVIGIESHGVSGGSARVVLRCSISNSFEGSEADWVVESRYFGEARAMSLWGGVDDGARPLGSSRWRLMGVSGGMAGLPGGSSGDVPGTGCVACPVSQVFG